MKQSLAHAGMKAVTSLERLKRVAALARCDIANIHNNVRKSLRAILLQGIWDSQRRAGPVVSAGRSS